MTKLLIAATGLCATLVCLPACQRLEPGATAGDATLPIEEVSLRGAIPLEYGQLVNVTRHGQFTAALWFEKPDKSIVVVRVNYERGIVNRRVLTIPRT